MLGRHNKITVAVRGCHSLEVPLADEDELLVNEKVTFVISMKFIIHCDCMVKRGKLVSVTAMFLNYKNT